MIFRALILSLMLCAAAFAKDSPYIIENIEAFTESDSEINAQEGAVDVAKKKGLSQLFERFLTSTQLERMKSLNKSKFDTCLSDYNIIKQRATSTSFKGQFQLIFDEACVRKNLNRLGIYFTSIYSPPMLLIPIFERNNKLYLWEYEDGYALYEAMPDQYGMSKFHYIFADLRDTSLISPDMAKAKLASDRFDKLASRYGISTIYYLRFSETPSALSLTITQENSSSRKDIYTSKVGFEQNDTAQTYQSLFDQIPVILDDYYKKQDLDI